MMQSTSSLEDDIELLARQPLFVDFSMDQLRLVAFGSQKLAYSPGAELFYNGQPADCGFLVVSGAIEITMVKQGRIETVGVMRQGDLIGEMALITPIPRVGTALVNEASEVLRIMRPTFLRVLEEYPELAALIYDRISSSVTNLVDQLEPVQRTLRRIDEPDPEN